jgi:putative transposase
MDEYETLNHTTWDCKYHVVFIPKYRRKLLFQELRKPLGEVFRQLAAQKESKVEEGHLLPDHVHMLLSIPPKYAVSNVVGYIKGKSAIHLARTYGERKRNFVGQSFWARGYFVSTVGRDEKAIREYIQNQEKKTNGWSNSTSGSDSHLQVAHVRGAALASPSAAPLSGHNPNSRVSDDTAALSG